MEKWKTIPNFSMYMASSQGRIKSLNYKRTGKEKILKPADTYGYLQTMLKSDSGKYKTRKVHKLITTSFLGVIPKGLVVNHKDGNKHNNNISNLEYVTQSRNSLHSYELGLQTPRRGDLNGMAKLTRDQVESIRHKAATGGRYWGRNKIALELGMSAKHLQNIVNNPESWK